MEDLEAFWSLQASPLVLQQFRPPSMRLKSQASPLVLQEFCPPSMRLKSQQATISQQTSPNSVLVVCMRIKIKL